MRAQLSRTLFDLHYPSQPPDEKLELQLSLRKCLFLYLYQIHPVFGFLNARIETWFPFSIQICLNGREWLARQMQAAGLTTCNRTTAFPGLPTGAQPSA